MSNTYALKFLKEGAVGSYSGFHWPVPNGKPGAWVKVTGDLQACANGIHATDLEHAMEWVQAECYVIELGGKVTLTENKYVARKGRLIRRVELGDRELRLFAADCAEHVLKHFENKYPDDKRPREAIKAARRYARRPSARNRELMTAAGAAAGAAEWDAAGAAAGDAAWTAARAAEWAAARAAEWDAARAAAGDAAWAAAWAAAGDAAWTAAGAAAGAAAGDAAWAAAGDAERSWQAKRLARYLNVPELTS